MSIDPYLSFVQSTGNGGYDTWIDNGEYANTDFSANAYLAVGTNDGGVHVTRGVLWFNLGSLPDPSDYVLSSQLSLYNWASASVCDPRPVNLFGLGAANQGPTLTWNSQPPLDAAGVISTTSFARYTYSGSPCPGGYQGIDATSLAQRWLGGGAPNFGLELRDANEADNSQFKWFYSAEAGSSVSPILTITYDHLPTVATPVSPIDNAAVATDTPTLTVNAATDADGDPLWYWFRGTPAPDAETGTQAIDSGWITPAQGPCAGQPNRICYTPEPGILADGARYSWHVYTHDGMAGRAPDWVRALGVNLHLGAGDPLPRDQVGGMSVNLVSGNAQVGAASPTFPTVGGPVGLTYAYNSQAPLVSGLAGTYYNDPTATHSFAGLTPAMVRRDPEVGFRWHATSPGPAVDRQNFMVHWEGWLTPPGSGSLSYQFYTGHYGGMRMWVNNTLIQDHWTDAAVEPDVAPPMTLTGGVAVPIRIESYQHGPEAEMGIAVIANIGPGGSQKVMEVPPSWLSGDNAALPQGWSMSPGHLGYVSARVSDGFVALADTSGGSHVYTWTGAGYAPPPGEDATLATDAAGLLSLHAPDGVTYGFDAWGALAFAGAATDDAAASSPGYVFSTDAAKPRRLVAITDPVGARQITLRYAGRDACPASAPPGMDAAAPPDTLCQVAYWDGTVTNVWYRAAQLARFEDPGGAVTDFAYTTGRITTIRNPGAADAVAAGTAPDNDTSRTLVAYDASPAPKVASVTLPVPNAGSLLPAPRPAHSYEYPSGTEARVHLAGLTEPAGFARKATFVANADGTYSTTDTDATARTTSATYDAGYRRTSATDAAGRVSTTVYDGDATRTTPTGRPTDSYGPAPAGCFGADRRPNASCSTAPAHTSTTFDTDPATGVALTGLGATYWANRTLSGLPGGHNAVGLGASGSPIAADPPAPGLGAGAWSGRYVGEIAFDQVGTYGFSVVLTGSARLFVDDAVVVDAGGDHPVPTTVSATLANTTTGRHRLRVDYATQGGSAPRLELRWAPPGISDAPLPAAKVFPRYSVPVRTTTDDATPGSPARVTVVDYDSLANGLVKTTTVDPGGLGLVTANAYEAPGAGRFMRPTASTTPAGTTTTHAYYGATEARTNPCGGGSANQAGAPRTTTGPDPDGPGPAVGRVAESVYDDAGRVVASRLNAEAWTCATYDARGRVLTRSVPAGGGAGARTVSYNYAVGANPLVTAIADPAGTITTGVDLLGRTTSYTDAWAKTTTSAYDQPGRLVSTDGPGGRRDTDYDAAGRPTAQHLADPGSPLAGPVLATPTYDSAGELASATYANASSLAAITRSPAGALSGLTWTAGGGGSLATDAVTRSQSGRVIDEAIDGTDAHPGPNFTYDAAGRLTAAWVPGHTLAYAFADTGGCGYLANAGRNSNRTTVVDNATTTTSCYDGADRLTSASDAAVGTPGYDAHGNTTTLGSQVMAYDGADRHTQTTTGPTKVLQAAVDGGLLMASPCHKVPLPKIETEEMRFLSPEEIAELAAAIAPRYRAFVLLKSYGGLRWSEMAGLRRGRLDTLRSSVRVAEQAVEVRGHMHFGPPKTRAGRRTVPLPRQVTEELVQHLAQYAEAGEDGLVFSGPAGGPLRAGSWRQRFWRPALQAAGLAPLRPHDLRHSAVSLWAAAGASPSEVAARAGHTSVAVVLDRYRHLFPAEVERTTGRLEAMFAPVNSLAEGTVVELYL